MQQFFTNGYNLIDLTQIEDKVLLQQKLAGVMSLVMKHIHERNLSFVIDTLKHILTLRSLYHNQEMIDDFIKSILCYYNINDEELTKIQSEVSDMALARFAQENIDKGIQQEKVIIAKNLLNRGLSLKEVSEITKISIEQLKTFESQTKNKA